MLEENSLAISQNANCQQIRNYITGSHEVLGRKDFKVNKSDTFTVAKIVLNSIKQVILFHSNYVCGSSVSINGNKDIANMLQSVYKKGLFNKTDYELAKNLVSYGNAYEYLYKENGVIKSKVIPNTSAFPYFENGNYTKFVERYSYNPSTDNLLEREYTDTEVKEYVNGELKAVYNNPSGKPIVYNTTDMDKTGVFGVGIVTQLIPICNEIEFLLSKMTDSINSLSLNPLLTISGQRINESVDVDTVGQILNLDDCAEAKYVNSNLDSDSIKLLLENLINQFYTVAMIPSSLVSNGNVANISSISLSMLYQDSDSYAKQLSFGLLDGFQTRLQYISNMLGMDVTGVDITFNYNKPTDYESMMNAIKSQYDMGAISKESVIRNSPYTTNVDRELELLTESVNIEESSEQMNNDNLVN